jgi:hypothetical protein
MKLWESKHSYYAQEGNYYSNDCHIEYKTLQAFIAAEGDSDLDYNLVYRWDWDETSDEDEDVSTYTGDDYYRHATLKVFFIGQRKARARSVSVQVCRADEPGVRAWLQPRLNHLAALWAPMSAEPVTADAEESG